MKLKFRKKHKHRLSKFDMFAGRYIEHDYNDEGQYHPTQMYPSSILNGKIKNVTLSKYHLVKKFNERKKEINDANKTKNTKLLKQLIKIHYFFTLTKKTYYLVKALKKAKKALKIWIRQLIQNEIYFFKKALKIAKTKQQMILIYLKYKKTIRKYKKIYIHYLKNIMKRYVKKTRRIKNQWKNVLTRGFAKGLKQKNDIIPFIFYIRKILFKKIRTGTLKQMKYWKKIMKKFARKYKITRELNINNLINTNVQHNSIEGTAVQTNMLKPFILLRYVHHMKKKSKPTLLGKINKEYYSQLLNLAKLKKIKNAKRRRIKKNKYFNRLITFYALICGKKKFVSRKKYKQRKLTTFINRMNQQMLVKLPIHLIKKRVENRLLIQKTISSWLISMQNWKKVRLFKHLNKLKKGKKIKTRLLTRKYKKRKRIKYKVKKIIEALKNKALISKKKKIKFFKKALLQKSVQLLKNKKKIRTRLNYINKIIKRKRIKQTKRKKRKWWRYKNMKGRIKKKIRRIAYKTPYILTCQFYRDYTGNWIELYKKKNIFNWKYANKITDQLTTKVSSRRQKRILRKNYRILPNNRFTMLIKHKEVLNTLNYAFTPKE